MESYSASHHAEVMRCLEGFAKDHILPRLRPPERMWQPSDLVPDMTREDYHTSVQALRASARTIPDALLVVLIGNYLTEEGLPTYLSLLNRHAGMNDTTGTSDSPWAIWDRGWTAEENRHGQVLRDWLLLSGRVQMKPIEESNHHLLAAGFDPGTANDPYAVIFYTAIQEPATMRSHMNTGALAKKHGCPELAKICSMIAGDEERHTGVYQATAREVLRQDPTDGVIVLDRMVRQGITMPAQHIKDREGGNLFSRFSNVAQREGVYTAVDYTNIIGEFIKYLQIGQLRVTGEAAAAQARLGDFEERYAPIAERIQQRAKKAAPTRFAWIDGRLA